MRTYLYWLIVLLCLILLILQHVEIRKRNNADKAKREAIEEFRKEK